MAVFLPGERAFDVGTSVVLILLYAAARLVGFEIATGYTCPVVLVLVPMLFLLPANLVPAHVAAGLLLGALLSRSRGRRASAKAVLAIGLSWHSVGPGPRLRRGRRCRPGPRRLARIPPGAGRDVRHGCHGLVVRGSGGPRGSAASGRPADALGLRGGCRAGADRLPLRLSRRRHSGGGAAGRASDRPPVGVCPRAHVAHRSGDRAQRRLPRHRSAARQSPGVRPQLHRDPQP